MKFDFGEVLTRMWKIGWNHKVLWLWQMLPGLFSFLLMPLMFLANPAFLMLLPEPLNELANETWLMVASVGLIFVLIIPIMFVSVIAQLTTTYGALQVEKGAEKLTFRGLFTESLPYFWRVLGLYAIFGGAWMLIWVGFMVVTSVASIVTFGLSMLCMTPMFLLFIPIMVVGLSVLELAQAAIVADNIGTLDAISQGWKLFRANILGVVLLMIVLYFALSMLSGIFVIPMMFPMMLLPLGIDVQGNFSDLLPIVFIAFFLIMFLVMYVMQGILMAFFQSAWAVAYLRMNQNDSNTPILMEEKP